MTDEIASEIARAADVIKKAKGLVVTAGAGMGVDSGLPDFRGPEGFWRAYPPYQKLGLAFEDLANPRWFDDDTALAWGFYGHRLNLYRKTKPHDGFAALLTWSQRAEKTRGSFVFTSNVDGQFQRAGFARDRLCEVHGAIERFQCTRLGCGGPMWPAPPNEINVDESTFRARPPFPVCRRCGAPARPNILMFGDGTFDERVTEKQQEALAAWLSSPAELVVVECGAGTGIPTVRRFGEQLARAGAWLVRINVREPGLGDAGTPGVDEKHRFIGIARGAKDALTLIDHGLL